MGIVLWSLLFISLAAATFVAAFGPANNDDPGARHQIFPTTRS